MVPVQLSAPASTPELKKKVNSDPPVAATALTVMLAPVPAGAVFVKVTTPVPVHAGF